MPHLDEGALHAYLDGALVTEAGNAAEAQRGSVSDSQVKDEAIAYPSVAEVEQHLSACADCRDALEKARELREMSASILSAAGPEDVSATRTRRGVLPWKPSSGSSSGLVR